MTQSQHSSIGSMIPQLIEYFPLIALLQNVGLAPTLDARAMAIVSVLRFLATKTDTPLDNEFLEKLEAVLRTQQGVDLMSWLATRAEAVIAHDQMIRESAAQAVA